MSGLIDISAFGHREDLEPDYLGALAATCAAYEVRLRVSFSRRFENGSQNVRADAELVRYARGCVQSFAGGGFDALFDFQRDFAWYHNAAPDLG